MKVGLLSGLCFGNPWRGVVCAGAANGAFQPDGFQQQGQLRSPQPQVAQRAQRTSSSCLPGTQVTRSQISFGSGQNGFHGDDKVDAFDPRPSQLMLCLVTWHRVDIDAEGFQTVHFPVMNARRPR